MKPQLAPTPIGREISIKPRSASSFWEEANQFIKSIEKQAYEFFEARGRDLGRDLEDWFKAEKELFKPIAVDITEKDNVVNIRAEVPGFKPEELEISLENDRLTIKGAQEAGMEKKEEKTHYSESRSRQVFRTLGLPVKIVPDNAQATLKNGVLEIKAPRLAEARPAEAKKIEVSAA